MDVRTLFLSYVIAKILNNENVVVLGHLFKILFLKRLFHSFEDYSKFLSQYSNFSYLGQALILNIEFIIIMNNKFLVSQVFRHFFSNILPFLVQKCSRQALAYLKCL